MRYLINTINPPNLHNTKVQQNKPVTVIRVTKPPQSSLPKTRYNPTAALTSSNSSAIPLFAGP